MSLLKVLACSMPAQERAAAGTCSWDLTMHLARYDARCHNHSVQQRAAGMRQWAIAQRNSALSTAAACCTVAHVPVKQIHHASPHLVTCLQVSVGAENGAESAAEGLSDEAIAQLVEQHLKISPAAFIRAARQQPPRSNSSNAGGVQGSKPQAGKGNSKQPKPGSNGPKGQIAGYESVEAFVGVMGKLLDMEREAEVAAAQEATSLCSTTAAQVRCKRKDTACNQPVPKHQGASKKGANMLHMQE